MLEKPRGKDQSGPLAPKVSFQPKGSKKQGAPSYIYKEMISTSYLNDIGSSFFPSWALGWKYSPADTLIGALLRPGAKDH